MNKVKAPSRASANRPALTMPKHCHERWGDGEAEEEPPGVCASCGQSDEEPGEQASAGRHRLFGHIPDSAWNDWRWHFRNRITTIEQLAEFFPIPAEELPQLKVVTMRYPLSITPYYLSLINPCDRRDPIRIQSTPSTEEMTMATIGLEDPLDEERCSVVPGLVHRYPDRVLVVITDICPMLCRHCTRKREWRSGNWVRTHGEVEAMLDYMRQHRAIRDVILSGGDPLTLSTRRLEEVISGIRAIRHVEIIRIGTRFPVVLPQRIDDELCDMLSRYGPIWLNTHFNHAREITPQAAAACDRLLRSGIPINNQSVLLCGVNDTVESQKELCHGLLRIKVRPYYLFQCDEVQGTEHLRTPVEVGIRIVEGLRGHTSGLGIPTFVIDLPHGGGKVPLQPDYVSAHSGEELVLRNYEGRTFRYRNPGSHPAVSPVIDATAAGDSLSSPPPEGIGVTIRLRGAEDADRAVVRS